MQGNTYIFRQFLLYKDVECDLFSKAHLYRCPQMVHGMIDIKSKVKTFFNQNPPLPEILDLAYVSKSGIIEMLEMLVLFTHILLIVERTTLTIDIMEVSVISTDGW